MSIVVGSKSYAFVTAYLLGVSHKVLGRDFADDYVNSNSLDYLKRIENAELLRTLSKMRQYVFHHYEGLSGISSSNDLEDSDLEHFLHILGQYGLTFDSDKEVLFDIAHVVNKLSQLITSLVGDVLNRFNFPHVEQVSRYFQMPDVTKSELDDLVAYCNDNIRRFPHWIFIMDEGRAKNHLARIFNEDKKLFVTAYAIAEDSYYSSNIEVPKFDWGMFGASDVHVEMPLSRNSIFYVDCDNLEFESFLSILDRVKSVSDDCSQHVFKLFLDETSDSVWNVLSSIVDSCFTLEFIRLKRIKESKSVVDVAMTVEITKDAVGSLDCSQVLVSSDSDFFGVIDSGILPAVFYDRVKANKDYIDCLQRQDITLFDTCSLDVESSKQRYRTEALTALCLLKLASTPIFQWNLSNLFSSVMSSLCTGFWYGTQYSKEEVLEITNQVLGSLNVLTGKSNRISALGIEVAV